MSNPTRTTYNPAPLSAGDFPVVMESVTIAADQVLPRGAVLGQITEGGEYVLSVAAATDGSEVPSVILEDAIDTTGAAASAPVRLTGQVLGSALTLGAGHTLASVKAALRPLSLFVL